MRRSPSPQRNNIDGGGEGPSFEGKTISLSSKEKKKKISFSSKEEENSDDHGQSGGRGCMLKTRAEAYYALPDNTLAKVAPAFLTR